MREINIRQFQRNFYQEIKTLPVIVTKRKKPAFIVIAPDQELKENRTVTN